MKQSLNVYLRVFKIAFKCKQRKIRKEKDIMLLNAIKIIDSCGKSRLFVYDIERPFDTSVTLLEEI